MADHEAARMGGFVELERDHYKKALEAITDLANRAPLAYLHEPAFHAAVYIAHQALEQSGRGQS